MKGTYQQTEAEFQQQVVRLARLLGYAVYHPWLSVRSTAGYPDLTIARPGRLILAELKSERGKLSDAQQGWLDLLRTVKGVEVYCWRPSDWDELEQVLRDRGEEGQ